MLELNYILGTRSISRIRGLAASATPAANNPPSATPPGGGRRGNFAAKKKNTDPNAKGGGKKGGGGGGGNEIGYQPVKATNEAAAWKEFADVLQAATAVVKQNKMVLNFHNHVVEFQTRANGVGRPIDILAKGAPNLTFATDVNLAVRAGSPIVAFIKQYPGRTDCLLLTDGPPDASGHAPALGKGDIPWKAVFTAAEGPGGVKFYLLTHGATELSTFDTVRRDLDQYRIIHA